MTPIQYRPILYNLEMQISLQLENTDKQFSGHRTVNLDGQEGEMTPKNGRQGSLCGQGVRGSADGYIYRFSNDDFTLVLLCHNNKFYPLKSQQF